MTQQKKTTKTERTSRRDTAAAIREAQEKAERRRSLLIIGPAVVVALLMVGSAGTVLYLQNRDEAALEAASAKPVEGVESFTKLSRDHVQETVDYPQSPPVGGDHASVWTNCGVYKSPVDKMQTVHSLEHGAVWLSYDDDASVADVSRVHEVAESNDYVVASPNPDQASSVMATAWGKQLSLDSADDPRLDTFVEKFQQGPQTPEPGAPCTGGIGGM